MCLILLANDAHPRWRLVVAANRDEFFARPTAPADWWSDAPGVLAGRDLRGGGTWMGVTASGRFAALTNVREPGRHREGAPSRGALVADYLTGGAAPEDYAAEAAVRGAAYNGFNLLAGRVDGPVCYASNRADGWAALPPGVSGVSNALLDTPWHKVVAGKRALAEALRDAGEDPPALEAALLDALTRAEPAPEAMLPATGVPPALERALSAAFIRAADIGYGTRAQTLLLAARDGTVTYVERVWDAAAGTSATRRFVL